MRYVRDKEKRIVLNKRYRENHKDEVQKYREEYYLKNKGYLCQYQKEYYIINKEHICNRVKKWKQENIEVVKDYNRNRDLKLREIDGTHTLDDLILILELQNSHCLYCNNPLDFNKKRGVHLDHFIPISRGGWNSADNLAYVCGECNVHKHNKLPNEWDDWNGLFPVLWDFNL